MALTQEEQRIQDETNAALARSQSFADGRRRVVPVRDQTVTLGHGMLTFKANEIIDDPYRIALMESYDIDFVELNVNDRKKRPVADESKGEATIRIDNVNAFAAALGIDRDVLAGALFGKQEQIDRAVEVISGRSGGDGGELKTFRAMLTAQLGAFVDALGPKAVDLYPRLVDGLTGDPQIDVREIAAELRAAIAPPDDLGAPPSTASEAKNDEPAASPAAPVGAAATDEFEPGTPAV